MPLHADRRGAGLKVIVLAQEAVRASETVLGDATVAVRARISVGDRMVERMFEREQRATHGLAWLATTVAAMRHCVGYADRLHTGGSLGEVEQLLIEIGLCEYLAQIAGGIPMSQGEIVRPTDFGLAPAAVAACLAGPLDALLASNPERCARLVALMGSQRDAATGDYDLDET